MYEKQTGSKVDVVYTVGVESVWDDNELRYSLRSLEENFKDLGEVYIVGHCPAFLNKDRVNHIPALDPYKENKDANLIQKLIRACFERSLSEGFVFNSDDQYILQPTKKEDLKPYYDNKFITFRPQKKLNRWELRAKRGIEILQQRGHKIDCFESHIPYLIDKNKYADVMLNYDFGAEEGYLVNSIYFNSIKSKRYPINDRVRVRIARRIKDFGKIDAMLKHCRFLNHNNKGLTVEMKKWIQQRFPNKSRFEL